MIEKKCSCERQMIAALFAGVFLALFVGFVLGWGWNKRSGALSTVSILSVLTAFGTVGAVISAVFSWWWVEHRRRKERLESALSYAPSAIAQLIVFSDTASYLEQKLGQCIALGDISRVWSETKPLISNLLSQVSRLDSSLLSELHPSCRVNLLASVFSLIQADMDVEGDYSKFEAVRNHLLEAHYGLYHAYGIAQLKLSSMLEVDSLKWVKGL